MEETEAADLFGSLAHPRRVAILRQLLLVAPDAMAAGVLAIALDTPPSSLSHHLSGLERAGFIRSARQQRNILYSAVPERVRALVGFFIEECCEGRPELCLPQSLSEKASA